MSIVVPDRRIKGILKVDLGPHKAGEEVVLEEVKQPRSYSPTILVKIKGEWYTTRTTYFKEDPLYPWMRYS